MKKTLFQLMALFVASVSFAACGDDDSNDNGGGGTNNPTKVAPAVVSTNPNDGATDIPVGEVNVVITYDKDITLVASKAQQISLTGATEATANASNKLLVLKVTCPNYGTQVTISLPEGVVTDSKGTPSKAFKLSFTTKEKEQEPSDGHETAAEAVKKMIAGWNLGNTLDSNGDWIPQYTQGTPADYETAWGQPVTDAHLIQAFKDKGFTAIRVPVTWYQHLDSQDNVDATWMARVKEVVDYVISNGMYCILNVHHDTGAASTAWLLADGVNYATYQTRYQKLWTQIATTFQAYDEHLLFEGYNEMLDANARWTEPGSTSSYTVVNNYAKLFVETVRATGGNNRFRNLIVTTYSAAHTTKTLQNLIVPTDPCGNQNHLAVEVHSYDPYNWVNTYNKKWTTQCTTEITNMFSDLNTYFISKGYPVIIGEYGSNGANEATINGSSTDAEKKEAGRQAADMTRLCKKYGAAAFYWMGIVDGADRSQATFKWSMEQVADSIVTNK